MSSVDQRSVPAHPLSPRLVIRRYGVYCSLALLLLIALVVRPEVYRPESLFLILRSASQLGMVALGQTLVMLVAGLDLSVSGLIVLTSVVIAQVGAGQDSHILPGLLISLGFGALIGLANGLLVTKRNVPPLVATLGMLVLIRGAQSAYTQGIPSGQVPDGLKLLNQSLGPLPVSFVIWIAFTALLAFILYTTPFGRRVYAIGSNREAARLSGIPVDRYIIAVYVICSLLVVGSGIMGQQLSAGNNAVALLGNTIATGAALVVLILVFGPISGAHFNPVVSLSFAIQGALRWPDFVAYVPLQIAGGIGGTLLAHLMFGQALLQASMHVRTGVGVWTGEIVATFALLATIIGCLRTRPDVVPYAVGLVIAAGYWFTSSTWFANPAVTVARSLTNSFAGIRPADAPGFVVAQVIGAAAATFLFQWLWSPAEIAGRSTARRTPTSAE